MGPGLYSNIGKKARDLLYKDFQTDHKLSVTTYTENGVAITTTGNKTNGSSSGEIHSQLKQKNVTVDVKANTQSNALATVTIDDLGVPGLKTNLSYVIPDPSSGKLELQYLHDYAGVNASIGLKANPIINLSTAAGTKNLAFGVDASLDTATKNLTKCNFGLSLTHADLVAALILNNKGDSVTGSYYHMVRPETNTAVGAELTHKIWTNEKTLTFGTQHALDPLTMVKARIDNYGKGGALIQHQWTPKSFFTISGEVDLNAVQKSSKVGLSLVLKP